MRQSSIAMLLAIIFGISGCAVAQENTMPGSGRDVPSGIPAEFQFLYQGFIPREQTLHAVWAALPYESITLERSNCMIQCPAYKVTLYRGNPTGQGRETYEDRLGRAELHAFVPERNLDKYTRMFPEKSGDFIGRVDIWTYARLCYLLNRSQFSVLLDRYEARWTDARTITVTATSNGKTKIVSEYGGVGPIELWGIQEAIDSVAQGINWTPK
ncbi:hypothetical protein EPO44_15480 [bacterium]|nr:MAG: hypothetical protein EPO44_15480 [bacterium]